MPEKWTSVSFPLTNLFPARIFITLIQTYLTSHSSRYTAARFVSSSYCSSGVLATSPPHLQLLTGRCKVYFIKFYCLFWPTEIFVSRFRTFTFALTFACDLSSFSGLSLLLLSTIRFVFCFFFLPFGYIFAHCWQNYFKICAFCRRSENGFECS